MMKKLVVLMLVLGVASLANATLQISVNGVQNPVNSEINLIAPSGTAILDIWTDAAMPSNFPGTNWALLVMEQQGIISGGVKVVSEAGVSDPYPGASSYVPGHGEGLWGLISITGSGIAINTTLYNEILLHCEGPGDAVVQLYETSDFVTWNLSDSVIIHQIPEPVTMVLLGLGGLFLRRR